MLYFGAFCANIQPPVKLQQLCKNARLRASHYLDILEGAFIIRRLQPYFANIGKRLTKSPKLYIRDSGLLHHLAGLSRPEQLETWPKRGLSWEGFVIEEIVTRLVWALPGSKIFFWRTQAGAEVDLIIENGVNKIAIEIKLGSAPSAQSLQGLKTCMADLKIPRGLVICGDDKATEVGGGITMVPWKNILQKDFIPSLRLGE